MIRTEPLTIRKSPFVFLKRMAIIEFVFAFVPLIAILLFRVDAEYENLGLARSVPFSIVLSLVLTALQILIIALTFAIWYLQVFQIDAQMLLHRRALVGNSKLAATQELTHIEIKRGMLGKRLNYGTLILHSAEAATPPRMRDITSPDQVAEAIMQMVDTRPAAELPFAGQSPAALIAAGEGQYVEFKSSLVWDYRQQKPNKALYEPVMKNVVGFMNSQGGVVFIGVGDDGTILGLEPDFKTLPKQDSDGFENVFNNAFRAMIGIEYHQFIDVSFPQIDDTTICMVLVRPATTPAFLFYQNAEAFYIRAGNASQPLSVSKAAAYIQSRFGENGARSAALQIDLQS